MPHCAAPGVSIQALCSARTAAGRDPSRCQRTTFCRHERRHRTLSRQAIKPVRQTRTAQQRAFDAFRREYNDERPHEAAGQQTPTSHCTTSQRSYSARLAVPEYPRHFLEKTITTAGTFRFGERIVYLTNLLTN